jgi:hypothetical protein
VRLAEQLLRPATYLPSIARAVDAFAYRRPADAALLRRDPAAVATRLARAMAAGVWQHEPARRRVFQLDKPRSLVDLGTLDRIVHGTVARLLGEQFEPRYSRHLYSYRRGRTREHVVEELLALAAVARRTQPDVRTRGLWVLRFDVARYTDCIPLTDASALWRQLAAWAPDEPPWVYAMLRDLTRCASVGEFADRGTPTGSPLCNVLLNLYLTDLDAELVPRCDAYLRFGDDVTIVAASAAAADQRLAEVQAHLAGKALAINEAKLERIYWNGGAAEAPAAERAAGWRGQRYFRFVGYDLSFLGEQRPKTPRRRAVLAAVATRLRAVARALPADASVAARADALCEAAAVLLDPSSPLAVTSVGALVRATSCRTQLAELDRELALIVASLAAGVGGPKAFRAMPWRALRARGLPSLTVLRNRGRQAAAP